jgi:hypothetical protein
MTVSTADISVLHSTEVAHIYPQDVFPISQGCTYLQSSTKGENPLWIPGRRRCRNPSSRKLKIQFDPKTSLHLHSSTPRAPFRKGLTHTSFPNYSAKGVPFHPCGSTVFLGGRSMFHLT